MTLQSAADGRWGLRVVKEPEKIRVEFENFILSEEQRRGLVDVLAMDVARAVLKELGCDAENIVATDVQHEGER